MNIVGVCGGNGVILHTMKKHLICNIEPRALFHTKGDKQWKANFGDIPMYKQLIKIKEKVDVVVGAPDCGHSSILSYSRKKSLSNPLDNASLTMFIKSIKKYRPKIFMMENLPKMLDIITPNMWKELLPKYQFIFHNGPVSMYGNSQFSRVRTVIIGIHKKKAGPQLEKAQYQFTHIYKVSDIVNTGELLKGLYDEDISLGHIREDIDSEITIYSGKKITLREAKKHWAIFKDDKHWKVVGRNFKTAPGVYRNLNNDSPLVARKANRQFNEDGLQMTPRELARIQSIPDSFNIYIDPDNLGYSINKGRTTVTKTPPYEIGKWFYKQLKKLEL